MMPSITTNMLRMLFLCLATVIALAETAQSSSQLDVSVSKVLTTTACNAVRSQPYFARLDLFYFYLVEYSSSNEESQVDTYGIEEAVATAVASSLASCDDDQRPEFAVDVAGRHRLADGGVCDSSDDGIECRVVRGVTSILLDSGVSDVEASVYDLLSSVLADIAFLNQFVSPPIYAAEYIRSIGENFVVLSVDSTEPSTTTTSPGSGTTAKIAISAAFTTLLVSAAIFYGVYRNHRRDVSVRSVAKAHVAHMHAKRRRYFEHLHDDGGTGRAGGWMTTEPMDMAPGNSITWSVSDLTSDGEQSIKDSLPMDRIDEEDSREEDEDVRDSEACTSPAQSTPPPMSNYDVNNRGSVFIANWTNAPATPDVPSHSTGLDDTHLATHGDMSGSAVGSASDLIPTPLWCEDQQQNVKLFWDTEEEPQSDPAVSEDEQALHHGHPLLEMDDDTQSGQSNAEQEENTLEVLPSMLPVENAASATPKSSNLANENNTPHSLLGYRYLDDCVDEEINGHADAQSISNDGLNRTDPTATVAEGVVLDDSTLSYSPDMQTPDRSGARCGGSGGAADDSFCNDSFTTPHGTFEDLFGNQKEISGRELRGESFVVDEDSDLYLPASSLFPIVGGDSVDHSEHEDTDNDVDAVLAVVDEHLVVNNHRHQQQQQSASVVEMLESVLAQLVHARTQKRLTLE